MRIAPTVQQTSSFESLDMMASIDASLGRYLEASTQGSASKPKQRNESEERTRLSPPKKNCKLSLRSRRQLSESLSQRILVGASVSVSLQPMGNDPSQALLDAMTSRSAIVAADKIATKKLMTSQKRLVFSLGTERVANAISRLPCDPEQTHKMGVAAKEFI